MLSKEEQFELDRIQEEFSHCFVKPEYTFTTSEEKIPMDDGILLRTILYRPVSEEAVPTIVVRTCYPNNDYIYRATAEEYAKRGFAYVYQYCRGTGGSEGEWEPNVNERRDGARLMDWVQAQPWIKNAGYFGCSYLALTGWCIADIVPEKVKTMYLTHYGVFRHTSAFKDGLFRHDVLTSWSMENAGYPVTADYLESCRYMPQVEVDEKLWGKKLEWYRKWITGTDRSNEYWNTGFWKLLRDIASRVKVPVYVGEGWYDHHLGSAVQTWCALPEETKEKSCFLIGAWDHGFNVKLGGRTGNHFENDDILRAFCWFYDILIKGETPKGSVDYYLIGADRWFSREKFEIDGQKELRLYLGDWDESGVYTLAETPDEGTDGFLAYVYDPDDPVMTHGAESLLRTKEEQGSLVQPKPNYRSDVVSCISAPFKENVAVCGKILVDLTVETNVDDTAFAVKVIEEKADGTAYNMRTGITTLGYRMGSDERQEYTPGTKVQIEIDMWDLAWEIEKGSRLRIDITSSDFPQYAVHSNHAGCWALQTENRKAIQKVYFGKNADSCVRLPIL